MNKLISLVLLVISFWVFSALFNALPDIQGVLIIVAVAASMAGCKCSEDDAAASGGSSL